jgi:hypothetical protein
MAVTHPEDRLAQAISHNLVKLPLNAPIKKRLEELFVMELSFLRKFCWPTRELCLVNRSTNYEPFALSMPPLGTVIWSDQPRVCDLLMESECHKAQRYFKLAENFGKHLHRVPLNLAANLIPTKDDCVLIQFPDGVVLPQPDGTFARCAYLWQINSAMFNGMPGFRTLRMLIPDYDAQGNLLGSSTWSVFPLVPDKTMDENFEMADLHNEQVRAIASYALKAYCYVLSGDPDLRTIKPPVPPETRKEKKLRHWFREHANESLLPLTIVGYDFLKERRYSVESTWVDEYLAWRRCGPGKTQARLVVVSGHHRHYENVITLDAETC